MVSPTLEFDKSEVVKWWTLYVANDWEQICKGMNGGELKMLNLQASEWKEREH